MIVLVTGGAGFIGSHTVQRLLREGASVRVLDDFSTGQRDRLPPAAHLQVIEGDIRDQACVDLATQGATHVLHLAAQVSVPESVQHPAHSHSVNVTGFMNVLDAARRHQVRRLVYASSAAVYGVPAALPLVEESPVLPVSPYGLEKLVNEQYAALYVSLYGLPSLGLRYFNVYGPRQDPRSAYSGVISKFMEWGLAGMPVLVHGDGLQTRDFVYVDDIARANVAALSGTSVSVINVGTGRSVTLLDLVGAIERSLGKTVPVQHLPARDGDILHSAMRPARLKQEIAIEATTSLDQGIDHLHRHLRGCR